MTAWEKQLQRTNFKANKSTVKCTLIILPVDTVVILTGEKPILYMKGYLDEGNNVRAGENIDTKGKRKQHLKPDSEPPVEQCRENHLEEESD